MSETIHFPSNQRISVYLHRNSRQQKHYLFTDRNLPQKVSIVGQQADPKWLEMSVLLEDTDKQEKS